MAIYETCTANPKSQALQGEAVEEEPSGSGDLTSASGGRGFLATVGRGRPLPASPALHPGEQTAAEARRSAASPSRVARSATLEALTGVRGGVRPGVKHV